MRTVVLLTFLFMIDASLGCGRSAAKPGTPQVVSGNAYIISGILKAPVTVTRLAAGVADEQLAQGTTDSTTGAFSVTLPQSANGDLWICVGGSGTTTERASGQPLTLSQNDHLCTLALGTHLGDHTQVNINPLSTLISARSVAAYRTGATLAGSLAKNSALFAAHFGTPDVWNASAIDLTTTVAPSLNTSTIYSLIMLGLSEEALAFGKQAELSDLSIINSLVLLGALVGDIGTQPVLNPPDFVFDGKSYGKLLTVYPNTYIDTETSRTALADAIEAFLTDPTINKSGLSPADVTQLTTTIRSDVSELYPPNSPPQDLGDTGGPGAPPVITITNPQPGQTLGANALLIGNATSVKGVAGVTISLDGTVQPISFSNANGDTWSWSFTPGLPAGQHVLAVSAVDVQGNTANASVPFTLANTTPAITLASCVAPDDRKRTATVDASGAIYSTTAGPSVPCTATTLASGSQAFYTYADLYEAGTPVPTLTFEVDDSSPLTGVSAVLLKNGTAVGPAIPLVQTAAANQYEIALNLQTLGIPSAIFHVADNYSLTISATDQYGNVSSYSFAFALNLLPTPLFFTEDSSVTLANYAFANGQITSLFQYTLDESYVLCGALYCPVLTADVSRVVVTNVSSRPATVIANTELAHTTPTLSRTVYRAIYVEDNTAWQSPDSPCPTVTQAVTNLSEPGFPINYGNQNCYTLDDLELGKQSQPLGFTPTFEVSGSSAGVTVANDTVTLAPGQQAQILTTVADLQIVESPTVLPPSVVMPTTPANLNYGFPYPPFLTTGVTYSGVAAPYQVGGSGVVGGPTDANGEVLGDIDALHGPASPVFGFLYQATMIATGNATSISGGGEVNFYGAIDPDYWDTGAGGTVPIWLYHKSASAPGVLNIMHVASFEHDLTFAATLNPLVAMSPADPGFVATPSRAPLTITSTSEQEQPNTCPLQQGLCSLDLSGW